MGKNKWKKSSLRNLNNNIEQTYEHSKKLEELLIDYLDSDENLGEKIINFANYYRETHVPEIKVKYKDNDINRSIVINLVEKTIIITPFTGKEKKKKKISYLLDRIYFEPTIFKKIIKYDEPEKHLEEFKNGLVEGLYYKVGTSGGTGFLFHLENDVIYFRYINYEGDYPFEKTKRFFEKIGELEKWR